MSKLWLFLEPVIDACPGWSRSAVGHDGANAGIARSTGPAYAVGDGWRSTDRVHHDPAVFRAPESVRRLRRTETSRRRRRHRRPTCGRSVGGRGLRGVRALEPKAVAFRAGGCRSVVAPDGCLPVAEFEHELSRTATRLRANRHSDKPSRRLLDVRPGSC